MRIVHVASGRLFGGIERMLVTMAACRGAAPELTPAFAVAAPGRLEQELRDGGADVTALGDVRLRHPASVVRGRAVLARMLRANPPAAVVCHAPWSYALFAPVARRQGVPPVLWQHEGADGRTLVERWARRTPAALVVCNSRWTSGSAAALQTAAPRTVIHPPVSIAPIPPSTRADVRQALGASPDTVVVLAVSRMEPFKGHLHLLRALASLRDLPAWTLWIAGGAQRPHEREYAAEVEREATRLGIATRVQFLGERRDVDRLMVAADVFCQMNQTPDAFGIVFAEALLSRVPVVTADLGGAPEIVSADCGILVPAGDVAALAAALSSLVRDSSLRSRLGAAGPAHAAARCAPEVVLPQLVQALKRFDRTAAA
jgi:glycosyltransferase involved in cell wall biosynthesis